MAVSNELLDSLLADYKKPEDLIGEYGLLKQFTKKLVGSALEAAETISSRWKYKVFHREE